MRLLTLAGEDHLALLAGILARGGSVRFRAEGSSMTPAIRAGDRITVAPVQAADLAVGEIVLLRSPQGRPLVHRVVSLRRRADGLEVTTRGDALAGDDEPVPADQVLGRMVAVHRGWRGLLRATWLGRVAAALRQALRSAFH